MRSVLGCLCLALSTALLVAQDEPATPPVEPDTPAANEETEPETEPKAEPQTEPEAEPQAEPQAEPEAEQDVLIADFEGMDYDDWTVTGEAFGDGPAAGAIDGQMPVAGFEGQGLANSFHGGDPSTGTLTSPAFTIERPFINLRVGGGADIDKVRAELVIAGETVRTVAGQDSETLNPATWDVSEFAGREATIVVIDEHQGGWGHLLVDQITQSSERTGAVLVRQERTFGPITPTDVYLNLPVKTGAPKQRMTLSVDDQIVREFDIELSEDPDFWAFTELRPFAGKTVTVAVNAIGEESKAMDLIESAATIKNEEELYQEPLRPQFHFSAKRGWINDPNGLVYHKGTYHLFFQHNPYGWDWGNMHWGHAVSPDLVHWEQLPIALYPRAYGDWAFSGGALVDEENTSGFKDGDEDVLVAFYTSTGRGECVVYSNDGGLTWTEYEGNPVIEHKGRDPKVIWHQDSRQWVMAVYNEHEDQQWIAFHTSPNLKDWTFQSRIADFYECPEIFEIDLDLDPTQPKWVIYGADGDYMLGSFDGKTFTPDGEKIKGNYGNCFYASQMYSNVPPHDRRHVQVAWGRIAMPDMPFNQQMLFPCTLRLRSTSEGPRLHTLPVREIGRLYQSSEITENTTVSESMPIAQAELLDVETTIDVSQARKLTFDVRGTAVTIDVANGQLTCLEQSAPLEPTDGVISLRLLVDRTSIEIYANDGRIYMPIGVILDPEKDETTLTADGEAVIQTMRVSPLKSIWK